MNATEVLGLTWHYVDHWAARKPDAEAVVNGNRRVTWAELQREDRAAARGLLAAGVKPGDCVAMLSGPCPEFYAVFMGANRIGAVWLGLSPRYTPSELRYMLGDCRPRVLVAQRTSLGVDMGGTLAMLRESIPSLKCVVVLGEPIDSAMSYADFCADRGNGAEKHLEEAMTKVRPEMPALLMYTSGSTGKPKGVVQTHANIIANVSVQVKHFLFDEDARTLLHFPINHVAAAVEIGYASIYAGSTTVMMETFNPWSSLQVIERERVTAVGQVPAMYLLQMSLPAFADVDWRHVRSFIWGGSSAPRPMVEKLAAIAAETGAVLVTGYGSTELCGFVTYSSPTDSLEVLAAGAGRSTPPFELRIVDENRRDLPQSRIGELAVRGPTVFTEYLNNPEATRDATDEDGWFYTEDLGWLDEHGNLYLSGRKSEMYKTGGENVYPREIEDVLEQHPAVRFAAVIGVPDPIYQEVGRAYVVLNAGADVSEDTLAAHCRGLLANFKVPKQFAFREELPLLPNGKVNKLVLRAETDS